MSKMIGITCFGAEVTTFAREKLQITANNVRAIVQPMKYFSLKFFFSYPPGKMPTVVYPESYRSRFIQSMDRYFLPVPDRWSGLGRDVDCWLMVSSTICYEQNMETDATGEYSTSAKQVNGRNNRWWTASYVGLCSNFDVVFNRQCLQ
jgi:hypothetical protein